MIFPNGPGRLPMTTRIATDVAMRDLGRQLAGLLRAGEPDPDSDVRTVQLNGQGARWNDALMDAVDRL